MNNKAIYFEPYVFATYNGDNVIIYNSLSGDKLQYKNYDISNAVKFMLSASEKFIFKLQQEQKNDPLFNSFINDLREGYYGDVINLSASGNEPFPIITNLITKKIRSIPENEDNTFDKTDFDNLKNIFLFCNNGQESNNLKYNKAFKQTVWNYFDDNEYLEMNKEKCYKLLISLDNSSIQNVHFLGGNLLKLTYLESLINLLPELNFQKTVYFSLKDILTNDTNIKILNRIQNLEEINIVILFDLETWKPNDIVFLKRFNKENVSIKFLVNDESEFEKFTNIIETCQLQKYTLEPFYNGKNLDFFQENIFFSKKELLQTTPKMKEINLKLSWNLKSYGKFYILPNFDVHSSLNIAKIGNLNKKSLSALVLKEVYSKISWKKTRDDVELCKNCIYKFLCPSISEFEYCIKNHKVCID